ncbi:putative adhesin [Enhygromyxa salina]|uniref:putative adhesin n=1 Tax=Enhygromyxa salina TaxID=215803 RepID=UPI0035587094
MPGGELFGPGQEVPNLVLHPVSGEIQARIATTQVTEPTLLSDMLSENMGFCVWAACRLP